MNDCSVLFPVTHLLRYKKMRSFCEVIFFTQQLAWLYYSFLPDDLRGRDGSQLPRITIFW